MSSLLIMGLIFLAVPFLFIEFFTDKKRGFIYVLFFLMIFHTFLAFFTQALGIFFYQLILGINLFISALLVAIYLKLKIKKKSFFRIPKIDWLLFVILVISFLSLYQVHHHYTGKINLASDEIVSYHEVKNMRYPYPYFSDEWYAVYLIKDSIRLHSLPTKNNLSGGLFLNLEIFFHSFMAEIVLILGLNPVLHYTILSIIFNTLIITIIYLFLRTNNISKLAAAVASLSTLYITCGANLPGLWHLLPIHLGIIFSLIGFCFIAQSTTGYTDFFMAILSSLAVIIFYGPLFIFYGLGLATFLLFKFFKTPKNIFRAISYFIIALFLMVPTIYIILMISPLSGFVSYITSRIFYISFSGPNMPKLDFYNIIPWWIILLAIPGIIFVFKNKKWLFAPFLLGVFYWFFYSFSIYRFAMEYERVVFFTSIIIVLISGFGLEELERFISLRFKNIRFPIFKYLEASALILFLAMIPFYTRANNWQKLIWLNSENGIKSYPKAPANNYLTDDDLRIFKNIKNKKFLSVPWKGTVIGITTDNYPLVTKEGTISINPKEGVEAFLNSSCEEKKKLAKKYNLDYIYLYGFDCPGFKMIDKSGEGFVLYERIDN